MSKNFYRLWLPISLLCHLLLFMGLRLLPLSVATIPGEAKSAEIFTITPVEQLLNTATPPPIPLKKLLPPPVSTPRMPRDRARDRAIRLQSGDRNVLSPGTAPVRGADRPKGKPNKTPAAAPKILTAPTGANQYPPGQLDGPGTQPAGSTQPSVGPTTGPVREGEPPHTSVKNAENQHLSGDGTILLSIDSSGKVSAASITNSAGG